MSKNTIIKKDNIELIGFFHENEEYGCFSNWYPAEFDYAGQHYANSEQYMMFQKVCLFRRFDFAEEIMKTSDPSKCKKIAGQKIPEFNPSLWERVGYRIVKQGVKAKFAQNEDLLEKLLSTGIAILAECSPYDRKWGIGIDINDPNRFNVEKWRGKNLLGRILMEVREELQQELLVNGKIEYIDAYDLEPISEWHKKAGELKRIPQFYNIIHTYSDTIGHDDDRNIFYCEYSLYDWEIAMRTNMGGGLPIAGFFEMKQEIYDTVRKLKKSGEERKKQIAFCKKYIPVLQMIDDDPDLKRACADHSIYKSDEQHGSLISYLYHYFMHEAYDSEMVIHNYHEIVENAGLKDKVAEPTEEIVTSLDSEQILGCIAWHFRRDHFINGSLISDSIAGGYMLLMLKMYLDKESC